jgi:uncharacterized membrane protein YhiD involved in acid resistance
MHIDMPNQHIIGVKTIMLVCSSSAAFHFPAVNVVLLLINLKSLLPTESFVY